MSNMKIENPPLGGRLPKIRHNFSTLVRRLGTLEQEPTYYELNGRFHGRYWSHLPFRLKWQHVTRVNNEAAKAVEIRTKKVLYRADIRVEQYEYVAVVHFLNQDDTPRSMRHVSSVTVSDSDFEFLTSEKLVRYVPVTRYETRAEELRTVILGLAPVKIQIAA